MTSVRPITDEDRKHYPTLTDREISVFIAHEDDDLEPALQTPTMVSVLARIGRALGYQAMLDYASKTMIDFRGLWASDLIDIVTEMERLKASDDALLRATIIANTPAMSTEDARNKNNALADCKKCIEGDDDG